MIKNIIFDMGQVLIKFDPIYFIKLKGINDDNDIKILLREVFFSVEWAMMDRGTLTNDEAFEIIKKRIPKHLETVAKELICDWDKTLTPIDGASKLIKELKDLGYKIYLLSNANLNTKKFFKKIPGSEYFDGEVISSYIGLLKPQPEIYEYLLNEFNLRKEECLFIDDSSANVEAAIHIGLNGIVFHGDYLEVREKLNKLNIMVNKN